MQSMYFNIYSVWSCFVATISVEKSWCLLLQAASFKWRADQAAGLATACFIIDHVHWIYLLIKYSHRRRRELTIFQNPKFYIDINDFQNQ